jgi:YesN/AraC family two-component response regulator
VLKPFSVSSIEEVIAKIRGQLEQEKLVEDAMEMTAKQLIERICTSTMSIDSLIAQLEKVIGKPQDRIRFGMFAVYGQVEESIIYNVLDHFSELQHAILLDDITVFLVLDYVNFMDTAKRIQDYMEEYCKVKFTVVFGEKAVDITGVRERYNIFILLRTPVFYLEPGNRKEIHQLQNHTATLDWEMEEKEQNHFLNLLRKEVMNGNQEEARQLTWNYMNHFIGVEKESLLSMVDRLFGLLVNQMVAEDSQLYQHMREEEKVWRNGMREVNTFHYLFDILWQYIHEVVEWYIQVRQNPNHHIVTYVKEYIDRNYHIEINVEYMAEGIHLSPNYLRSIFKESTGKTIGEYIKEYRFTKACELLKDKARKVKEISKLVGYEDVSYFCASFMKRFGESPNEYRKHI